MMRIRPIHSNDLDQLEALSIEAGVGMTTLPSDRASLEKKIKSSQESFRSDLQEVAGEYYLFVLEDVAKKQIAGTCGIMATTGYKKPFYSYKLGTLVHYSEELGIHKEVQTLTPTNDLTGMSEVCTLFLTKGYRHSGNGRLLSRIRFLFLAEFANRFHETIIAEMRGVQDQLGRSPFWRNVGYHFFDMDFSKADYLSAVGNKQFISDLMPKYPIYLSLLPIEAQEVVGVVHDHTKPALKLLERENFRFKGYVDIFDAGPTVQADLQDITTIRNSHKASVSKIVDQVESVTFLIANCDLDFRGTMGTLIKQSDGSVWVPQDVATALEIKEGDSIRFIEF